jgi:hypothetical protein
MAPQDEGANDAKSLLEEIVALERAALDRWITLDPQGYLNLFAPEITYFDPTTDARVDGPEALKARLAPIRNMKLPFKNPRYEMLNSGCNVTATWRSSRSTSSTTGRCRTSQKEC